MVSELYAGISDSSTSFRSHVASNCSTYNTVNVKRMLAAVVSHELRTLKVSILRPNQNLCQTGTEQTPSISFTDNKSGVQKFSKDLGDTSKLQTP
jgi:hypothetical protein